jgi:hypothetical protein
VVVLRQKHMAFFAVLVIDKMLQIQYTTDIMNIMNDVVNALLATDIFNMQKMDKNGQKPDLRHSVRKYLQPAGGPT